MENKKKIDEKERLAEESKRRQEMEQAELLMRADREAELVFSVGDDNELVVKQEIADMTLEEIDDPKAKYQLYYNVLNRLLMKHLPKGEEFKQIREYIYEEKNTFLTRGHRIQNDGRRGADGRMSYSTDINEIINIVTEWIMQKGTLFDLYTKLRDLNVSKGYGTANVND